MQWDTENSYNVNQMNQISALNNPSGVDLPLNKLIIYPNLLAA